MSKISSRFNKQQVYWHSRRGMLELDLLLMPFAETVFESLDDQEQMLYVELLAQEDQELWNWMLKGHEPSDARFKPLLRQILAYRQNPA